MIANRIGYFSTALAVLQTIICVAVFLTALFLGLVTSSTMEFLGWVALYFGLVHLAGMILIATGWGVRRAR